MADTDSVRDGDGSEVERSLLSTMTDLAVGSLRVRHVSSASDEHGGGSADECEQREPQEVVALGASVGQGSPLCGERGG